MHNGIRGKNVTAVGVMLLGVALTGCCQNQTKAEAGPPPIKRVIGLADAISQVQEAVYEARKTSPEKKIGVMASKVTLNLKLTATDVKSVTGGYTLGVELGPVTAGVANSQTTSGTDAAESTITLELVNPYLADKDTLLGVLATSEKAGGGKIDLGKLQLNLKDFEKGLMELQLAPGQSRPDR